MFELGELRSLVHSEPTRAKFLVLMRELLAVQDEHTFEVMLSYAAPIVRDRWPGSLRQLEISAKGEGAAYVERLMLFELVHTLRIKASPEHLWALEALLLSPHLAHLHSLSILEDVGDAQLLLLAQTPHLHSLKQLELSVEELDGGINVDNLANYSFTADSLKALFNSPHLRSLQEFKLEIELSPSSIEAVFIHQPQWPNLDVFELDLWGELEPPSVELLSQVSSSPVTALSLTCTDATPLLVNAALSGLRELTLSSFDLQHAHVLAQGSYPRLSNLTLNHIHPIDLATLAAPNALPALTSFSVNIGYDEDDDEPTPCDCAGAERVTSFRCWGTLPDWFWENVSFSAAQSLHLEACSDLLPVYEALRRSAPVKLHELLITDSVVQVAQLDTFFRLKLPAVARLRLCEVAFEGPLKRPIRAPQWPQLECIELLDVCAEADQWRPILHSPWMQYVSCLNLATEVSEPIIVDAAALHEALKTSPYLGRLTHLLLYGFMPPLAPELWRSANLKRLRSICCSCDKIEAVIAADTLLAAIKDGQLPTLTTPTTSYYSLLKVEQDPVWSPSSLNLSPFELNAQVIQSLNDGAYLSSLRSLTLGACVIDEQAFKLLMVNEGLATLQRLALSPLKLTPKMCEALGRASFLETLSELTLYLDGLDERATLLALCAIPAFKTLPRVVTAPWGKGVLNGEEFVAALEQRLVALESQSREADEH